MYLLRGVFQRLIRFSSSHTFRNRKAAVMFEAKQQWKV